MGLRDVVVVPPTRQDGFLLDALVVCNPCPSWCVGIAFIVEMNRKSKKKKESS
jgi:hypothetical protein